MVLAARVGLPVWRSLRHQVRVVGTRPEGPGVVSVVLRGRKLDQLPVAGGQFFQWRFLRRGLWWQAHPYSLSAAPSGDLLRTTVKGAGVGTAPILALLQELPQDADVAVILRASTAAELVLRDEVAHEVRRRRGRLVELIGSRAQVRIDADALRGTVPDVHRREVYLCGPDTLSHQLASELKRAGVPEPHIHFESFAS